MAEERASNRNTEILFRLDEKVGEILRRMGDQDKAIAEVKAQTNTAINANRAQSEQAHEDFNKRISALENFRWWFLGVGAAAGVIFSLLKDLLVKGHI